MLEDLVKESKARRTAVTKMFKPYANIRWLISAGTTTYVLIKSGGEFTLPLFGLIALTCFLSLSPRYSPPIGGMPLFGRRVLALLTDFLIISTTSFFALFLLQSKAYLEQLVMLVVWLAFLYFVVLDWRFNGTLGKRLCGLRVTGIGNTKVSFCKSFIRVFLTLPLPIICSGLLRDFLMGDGSSRLRFLLGEGFAQFALYFVPMSILFLGGNQSIADKIVGVSVQQKWQRIDSGLSQPRLRTWLILSCSTFVWAFLLAALTYTGVGKIAIAGLPEEPPAIDFNQAETITDEKTIAPLWAYLPMNLREPTLLVRKIELFAASPNPFTFRAEDSQVVTPFKPERYLKELKQVRFVRVTLAPYTFTATRMVIVQNFLALGERSATTQRPSFALLQFGSEQKYGLFSINSQENILICWMGSDTNPIDFPMEVHPRYGISPQFSAAEIYNLLLGNTWIIYVD